MPATAKLRLPLRRIDFMNALGFQFKRALEESVHRAGESLGQFRKKFHVDDFFAESIEEDDNAAIVAGKALHELCLTDDGRFNCNVIALKAAMVFLHAEASDSPQIDADCKASLLELNQVLAGPGCTLDAISGWVDRWYRF